MSEPKRYRKKPVVIEAMHHTGGDTLLAVSNWCGGGARTSGVIVIETLEGEMRAQPGDYVIRGVQGEFYPCKASIFEATYEPVEDDA